MEQEILEILRADDSPLKKVFWEKDDEGGAVKKCVLDDYFELDESLAEYLASKLTKSEVE